MKKIRNLLTLIIGIVVVALTSCNSEEPDTFGKPVLNKDFTVTVDGNNVSLSCTNKAVTSALWEVSDGSQYTDKISTAYLPLAGDYSVVLSVSNGGDYISADTVKFTIASNDEAYFNTGILKSLTGGTGATKTWVLDVAEVVTQFIDDAGNITTSSAYKSKYFHNPLDFYGDATAGLGSDGTSWGPWGGTNIYDWGGTPENGSISFDATGQCTLTLDGVVATGRYGIKKYDRPTDIISPALADGNTLWQNMLTGKYSYLGSLSSEMADIKFASGMRFPMDKGRITNDDNETYPSQFLTSDLENVTIIHCSDSALVVRVKRTYEGDKESKCWLLYNYIVKEYNYPTTKTYTHPVKTIADADLTGTWKLAPVPANWIGWAAKNQLNTWADGTAMNATFDSWGQTNTTEKLNASQSVSIVFNTDHSCTISDFVFNTETALVETTNYNTTYSVNAGYITFGDDVVITGYTGMISLTGTHVYALDVSDSSDGLWIGQNNESKEESKAVHLIKQQVY